MIRVFIFFIGLIYLAKTDEVDGGVSALNKPEAKCQFSIHEKSSDGPELTGTSLNSELYYKIKCDSVDGYCLKVSNCTVSGSKKQKPILIIDQNGCTNEPSLFEHVQYLDDFTAGIYNPVPIRFRDSESGVQFECATTLSPKMENESGKCEHKRCIVNEYSKESNLKL